MSFKTVALVGRYQDSQLGEHLRALAEVLRQENCRVLIEADTAAHCQMTEFDKASFAEMGQTADLAIVLGGDGTMLGAARNLAPWGVPVAGINHGRLGFITDIPLQNAHAAVIDLLAGRFETESRNMLSGSVSRSGQELFAGTALNDVVINRAGRGGMIEVRVDIDGKYMFTLRADGLIVATPTGSTAYALSAMGPILHPSLNAMLLVPVAPQTLSNRPIVIPDQGIISLTVLSMARSEGGASVHFDMQTWSDLQPGDCITVQRAPDTAQFLHPTGYSFFSTLRKKLGWNSMPSADANEP
jgi:NAD+ kinase